MKAQSDRPYQVFVYKSNYKDKLIAILGLLVKFVDFINWKRNKNLTIQNVKTLENVEI